MDKLRMETKDMADENFRRLQELFPEAVTETIVDGEVVRAIDKDVLQQLISTAVVDGPQERYQFTWPDKRNAVRLASEPINKTLRPCREESVDFDNTENLYIEGDNLDVLKLLQETYLHKIKMIYIDPPYNTGNNLIYKNDFHTSLSEYKENSGQTDAELNTLVANPETNGRFHTDWLNMIYPRLKVAKSLLTSDGVLVCAIDENEVDTLSLVIKSIFGESSYEVTCVTVVHNPRGQQGTNFSHTNEYALFVYPKGIKAISNKLIPEDEVSWSQFRNWGSESERHDAKNCFYSVIVRDNRIVGFGDVLDNSIHPQQTEYMDGAYYVYPIDKNGVERKWRYARQTADEIKDMLRARKTSTGYEIEIGKTFGVQKTVWAEKRYDANEYGSKIIANLIPNNGFTFPKSLWTVYDSIFAATSNDQEAIVLDFFSGSATTAHAVVELNAYDNGTRKYILVQYPEKTSLDSESYKNGYKNICEIGKERMRRAGAKIKEEKGLDAVNLDTGFRVLKLDCSNMKDVYYNPGDLDFATLDDLVDNIKDDRTPEDLLFQVMLELGVLPSSKIVETEIACKKVFDVAENFLIACFDKEITEDVITEIAKKKPYYFVMRDASMATDSVATNFEQIFATYSPDTVRKVL